MPVAEPALHPESTPDPAVLVWHVAPGPVSDLVDSDAGDALPPGLAGLVSAGVLARVRARPGLVTTTIADDKTWTTHGASVRTALYDDLSALAAGTPWPTPEGKASDGGGVPVDDEQVAAEVRRLLDGPVGAVAASHGGSISLIGVEGGVVTVELHGACHGCPAAENTLGRRIEAELRRLHPGVREVRHAGAGECARDHAAGRPLLRLWPRRR